MMKLVISFDEFQKEFGQFDKDLDHGAQVMEAMTDWLIDYLENQFPEWNIETAFNINDAYWDFDNNEVHIDFIPT